jgi:2-isopropylmalate synthase
VEHVQVLDTTLRDGEQAPGIAFDVAEKLAIATGLADLATDIIEAGFPAASAEEHHAVSQVARMSATEGRGCTIAALSRCVPGDIALTADALEPAARSRLHLVLSTSDRHRRIMHPGLSDDDVLSLVSRSVVQATARCDEVQFSAQDASRTAPEFLKKAAVAARDAGASVFNVCDTVGYAVPEEYGALVAGLVAAVPHLTFSVHCHNDLGLAVANSLAGLRAGARQVEVAVNGMGERAGNCPYEEIVMLLKTRGRTLGLETSVNTSHLARVSAVVADATGYPVPANKAVVGANAFRHESGMHQHGVLADRQSYEVMQAEDIGRVGGQVVLGKHSGRHALRAALEASQLSVDEGRLTAMLQLIKTNPSLADDLKSLVARTI